MEQIDLLFSGPRVLIDMPESELVKLQEQEIQMALAEHRVELTEGKDLSQPVHVETV